MDGVLRRVLGFFVDNFPGPAALAVGIPAGLVWAGLCLHLAAHLKTRRGWKTGYTRKVFHFAIFVSVAVLQGLWGTPEVCLFGGMTSLVVLHAVLRGAGHPHYEALAREKDAPRRTTFVVVPYVATLLGGLASNILFFELSVVGYLATGLGDAVGEPAGTRFGRHRYPVPCLGPVWAERSLEGSAAVFLACVVAVALGGALTGHLPRGALAWWSVPVVALCCAVVEAVSPHGWDNLTLQLVPAWATHLLWIQA